MAELQEPLESIREIVGVLSNRDGFDAAVRALRAAGFEDSDLSVLSSHESLEAAEPTNGDAKSTWKATLAALTGEYKYLGPLVASGAIFLAGGPVAAVLAAVIGAAVGGAALTEIVAEVTSHPDAEDFTRALEAGSVILWVRVVDSAGEALARQILAAHGATNIHPHESARAAL